MRTYPSVLNKPMAASIAVPACSRERWTNDVDAAFVAGMNFMRRTAWLLEAHKKPKGSDERSLCVSFAWTAHRAYLRALWRIIG